MDPHVVGAGDLEGEPGFQLVERHHRLGFGIKVAALENVREMRARQQVHRPHHCADQAPDMPAVARRAGRAVLQVDLVFGTGKLKSPGMELGAIARREEGLLVGYGRLRSL